ncbi:MAG TPA: response regulator transcription factor [Candidatus Dormibacteraeota bacterium]|nr:response regulator transcription factor [Candidatus Dormibacteraeota bacterium]
MLRGAEADAGWPRRVLIVDPDTRSRREIALACRQDGFEVVEASTGEDGLARFREFPPSVVVLEVALPDVSGFDVCRELRRATEEVPIILIGSSHDEVDVVVGLEIGADDYVTRPVRLRELTARIAANLRRARVATRGAGSGRLEFRDLVIDLNERRVLRRGREVGLTHTEFELLSLLAENAGKALSRERILQHIWGAGHQGDLETRVIDVHIRNLRRKIEDEPSRPFYLLAVPGIGYRFTNARPEP